MAAGVGQVRTAPGRLGLLAPRLNVFGALSPSVALGVGQPREATIVDGENEDPGAFMLRADFRRADDDDLDLATKSA